MSLIEHYHAAHKERLQRLSPTPPKAPVVPPIRQQTQPQAFDAGWEDMWFHDLVSLRATPPGKISVKDIQIAVAEHYRVGLYDILSHRRTWDLVLPRHVAMYLTKKLTHRSLPEIGRLFGRRDHTTVLYAVNKIESLVETDDRLFSAISQIRRRFT
jgi:hypothetical protein